MLGALAMAAASCDDKSPEVPAMQANPQEPILAAGDIEAVVIGPLAETGVFALETAPVNVEVVTTTATADLPEGATVRYVFELANSADFTSVKEVPVTMNSGVAVVSSADWNEAHIALFGKSPKEKTAYWRIPVYVDLDGTSYRYSSTDYYAAQGSIVETCKDAGFTISSAYYFVGTLNGWSIAAADAAPFKFDHSAADVYDDPVFTLKIEITEEQLEEAGYQIWWKIASQEAIDDQNWDILYGPEENGDENLAGMLFGDGAGQSGVITESGKFNVVINMEEMTYDIQPILLPDYVAVPSNANGWGEGGPRLWYTNNETKPYFYGCAVVNNTDGGYKFIWDGTWIGFDESTGKLSPSASDNIRAPKDANTLYWFTVNTVDMTYTIDEVTSIGVIGDFNSWAADVNMTPDATLLKWSADVNLSGAWKIRVNENWDINYGGDIANPVLDGDNFSGFDGLCTVTIDFSNNAPIVTVVAK